MRFRGPLSGTYPAAVLLVVCALIPYLALASALTPLTPILMKSVGLSKGSLQLATGMANAAYAFGTVLAVQLAVHLPPRRMLVIYASLFVLGSVMAASAITPGLFIAGHVIQGLTTSLMLIAAVPPLIIGWPTSRMRYTAVTMNLCIFGAVAAGPVIGGVQAGAQEWQPLFWIVTGFGAAALVLSLLTFEDQPPQDHSAPWDLVAMALAGFGSAGAFFGASELTGHPMLSPIVLIPLLGGLTLIGLLVAHQYYTPHPLMPVRNLFTSFPATGVIIAIAAGAASVAVVGLVQTAMLMRTTPIHLGMLFWPELGGAVLSAAIFGALFRTRFVPVVALTGLVLVAGGAAILTGVATGPQALVVVGSGVLGLGVGASVSPALFIAGFSLASAQIQRIFALVELLRGVAAFMVAPVILHLAMTTGAKPSDGINIGIWVAFAIAATGALLALYVLVLGRAKPQVADLDTWLEGEKPAWDSPPLADGIRHQPDPLELIGSVNGIVARDGSSDVRRALTAGRRE